MQVGRSFFTYPTQYNDLGDFYELWTGLFQSTILGSRPYVNVDIAHKAFPSGMDLLKIVDTLCANNRAGGLNMELDRRVEGDLDRHLKGLRIIYAPPGGDASRKSYKYSRLGLIPEREMFTVDGQQKSVLNYFQSKGITLRYPKLKCVKVGNAVRSISLPMEYCSVAGGQVSLHCFKDDN